jgi:hypothetical protein
MNIKAEMADSPLPDRLDRRNAQARHDRWALEMDRALFAVAPAPVRQPGAYAWQSPSESPTLARTAAHDIVRHAAPGHAGFAHARDEDRAESVQPEGPAAVVAASNAVALREAGTGTDASAEPATIPPTAAPAPAAAAAPAAGPMSAARGAALPSATPPVAGSAGPSASAAGTAPPQPVFTTSGVPQWGNGGVITATGTPLAGIGGTDAASLRTAIAAASPSALDQAASFSVPETAAGSRLLAAGNGAAPFASLPAGADRAADASDEEGPRSAGIGTGIDGESGEEYAQRLLHLYEHDGDVQAWIRDAELQPTQARAVAQALAMQLAVQGTRLATLTINGRAVEFSAERGQSNPVTDLFDQRLTDAAAASSPDQGDSPT